MAEFFGDSRQQEAGCPVKLTLWELAGTTECVPEV